MSSPTACCGTVAEQICSNPLAHNDRRTPQRHLPRRRSWGCDSVTEPLRIGVVGATE